MGASKSNSSEDLLSKVAQLQNKEKTANSNEPALSLRRNVATDASTLPFDLICSNSKDQQLALSQPRDSLRLSQPEKLVTKVNSEVTIPRTVFKVAADSNPSSQSSTLPSRQLDWNENKLPESADNEDLFESLSKSHTSFCNLIANRSSQMKVDHFPSKQIEMSSNLLILGNSFELDET